MFGSAAMEPASQFSRTADHEYIHQLDCALYAPEIKTYTKFRVDGNVTHSLVASLRLSCENRSGSHRVNFADSIHKPRWSFRYTPVLYWGRSRLEKIISRTREYYRLNLSPSTRRSALLYRQGTSNYFAPSGAVRSMK
jgi:hypothetical protein